MEDCQAVAAHPEFESEQAYITFAYECLDRMRASARQLQQLTATGAGGTHQARFERDAVEDRASGRLSRLQIGTESLVFGRIDRVSRGDGQAEINGEPVPGNDGERFYIGRLPVSDADQNPIVVDWRAPVAEAFYRATGRNPLGLERLVVCLAARRFLASERPFRDHPRCPGFRGTDLGKPSDPGFRRVSGSGLRDL